MRINDTDVTNRQQPYLIAEIGVNHFDIADEEDISKVAAAKKMVAQAADAGVDAVKFQSYSAESLASRNSPAYWDTEEESTASQYELFSQYDEFGAAEFEEIAAWSASNYDIDFLSTPFDHEAVDYLDNLVPAYKVASADITNYPLLRHIARKGKPILLSTGASTVGEIDEAVRVIESEADDVNLCLMHCILQYPTDPENANLGMIEHIDRAFPEYTTGYSDHVPPDDAMLTLVNATVRGADVIEKHFTLDKTLEGNDHYHAMNPDDVREFRDNLAFIARTTGEHVKHPIEPEEDSRLYARRSLVAATDIDEAETITREHIAVKRPGTGIEPAMLDEVVGRVAPKDIDADEILMWDML
ncbi:N-acetylneuraminate synthase [Halovenus aranensis]|uniref:N-acetylneuraminate synthase n=1 Tax=Halovenus aranensis TaxID=890420 RepID=A0A1G8YXK4_9EURY|nr:N-acetylneuraminate synthase family protein [Halovenus aranensis]SDK06765.1 N-acetylneuraminate synthase [Halovenus aranensis]